MGSSLRKMALIYCLIEFLSTGHLLNEQMLNKRHQSIKSKRFSAQRIYMQKSVTKNPPCCTATILPIVCGRICVHYLTIIV